METKDSYFIKRDGSYIWLSQGVQPQDTDEVIEIRKMLIAKEGYTLEKDGEIVGSAVWIKDGDSPDKYTEVELPPEPEEEENE